MGDNMHFEFCSITTLDPETRDYIYRKMAWDSGAMQRWINSRCSNVRLCLLYNSRLATWASLSYGADIGAWTLEKYRKRGYAHTAIWALLEKHRVDRHTMIQVHSKMTGRVVRHLGFKARY